MPVRITMVKVGVWDVPGVGKRYRYRVCTAGGRDWSIYKMPKERVLANPAYAREDGPAWEFVGTGFKSKASAVEYVEELATLEEVAPPYEALLDNMEKVNPVSDLLNNIDDGADLDEDII